MDSDLAGQALAILLVFGLLALAVWRFGRGGLPMTVRAPWKQSPNTPRALEAAERLILTPQHAVHLLRFDGRTLIVATHPQGCSLLVADPDQSGTVPRGARTRAWRVETPLDASERRSADA